MKIHREEILGGSHYEPSLISDFSAEFFKINLNALDKIDFDPNFLLYFTKKGKKTYRAFGTHNIEAYKDFIKFYNGIEELFELNEFWNEVPVNQDTGFIE